MASNNNDANDPNNPNIPAFNNAQPNQPPFNPNSVPNPINAPAFGPPPPPNFFQQQPNLPIHPPFTGPQQPPHHPSFAFLNQAATFNQLAAALQWQPAPQHFTHPGNAPLDVGFGGLNIQGLELPQEMQPDSPYGDGMDVDGQVAERREVDFEMGGLDFGNPDEDYSEDSEFEYDDVEEWEDDDEGQGQNQSGAQGQSEGHNLATEHERGQGAEDISQPRAAIVEENAPGEIVYEEEDSEWEDDPTGYEDPHAATSALPQSTALPPSGIPVSDYSTADFTALDAFGIRPDAALLVSNLKRSFSEEDGDPDLIRPSLSNPNAPRSKKPRHTASAFRGPFPFFESLATHPELYFELATHLPVAALLSLYAIQRDFHETINGHLAHAMKSCARRHAPESAAVFAHGMYQALCVRDPARRPDPRNWAVARWVPGLRWLQMVVHRERVVRDIVASLAREGHRTPADMGLTLKKVWVVMDVATTAQRISLVHNEAWFTDQDCWNAQCFVVKLNMRFNDPLTGVGDDGLMRVMLGQRGLTPLCRLLKREAFLEDWEVLQAAVRYCYEVEPEHHNLPIFGIPPHNIGRGHLEGWGRGKIHLFRIDELVMRESVRRRLDLDDHLLYMALWGHVDPVSMRDIRPTDAELYMSDSEDADRAWRAKRKAERRAAAARVRDEKAGRGEKVEVESEVDSEEENFVDEWAGIGIEDGWETEDEDGADESLFNDVRDSGAVGPSGWRKPKKDEYDTDDEFEDDSDAYEDDDGEDDEEDEDGDDEMDEYEEE